MKIDFIFGLVVFGLIIFFIATQINVAFTTNISDALIDTLRAKGIATLNSLAESSGSPPDWENNPAQVKIIGLSYPDEINKISTKKILALNSSCTLLDNLNLGSYRLEIRNSTNKILFCGFLSQVSIKAVVTKFVFIDGDYGNMTIELW